MKNQKIIILLVLAAVFIIPRSGFGQYLHRDGKKIVDGTGQEVILRGMGLGGWMLQEGYMLETNSFANPQHQIRAKIVEVIGEQNTREFYEAWLANHCTKRDIDSLAAWGFNSVRLPMHYNLYTLPIEDEPVAGENTWLEKGFAMTDSLLRWCEANQLYLILDLHAAPGGQGRDAAISDYDTSKPSLWESEANKQKTIALWRKLAERYANKKWIGGYDLINETNWAFEGNNVNGCNENNNAPLKKLMVDITNAIREIDTNHIIYIEGNCWANNHNGLLPYWDENMVLSFHKYWNYNDQNSVQGFVNLRNQHNVPLWLGETGENSNVWFRNAIKLMEENKIGWAWWPLKKVGSVVNPLTVVKNDGYNQLLEYWKGNAQKPSVDVAKAALMQLAENLKIENNIFRPDVIDAMFRQVNSDEVLPFKNHRAPGIVHASDYDLGRYNKAYVDSDTATYHVSGGEYTAWNSGWSYRNDGVDIQGTADTHADANGFNVGWTATGEWLQYTVVVDSTAAYNIDLRYAVPNGNSSVRFLVNGLPMTQVTTLPSTGSYATYQNTTIEDIVLQKGVQRVRLYFEAGGANISFMKFVLSKKTQEVAFNAVAAETFGDASLKLVLNKNLDEATLSQNGFSVAVDGNNVAMTSISAGANPNTVVMSLDVSLNDANVVTVSYSGDEVLSPDGTLLEDFTNLAVKNNLPIHLAVPGKIEAENFIVNQGLQLENTSDVGGGQNVGYTNAGDFLEYRIRVAEENNYTVKARVACNAQAGRLQFEQLNAAREVINTATLDVPVTGGWQTWTTVETEMLMNAGTGFLRVKILQPEFNFNWFEFEANPVNGIEKSSQGMLKLYPNPADSILHIELPEKIYRNKNHLTIRNAEGKAIADTYNISQDDLKHFNVAQLKKGVYYVEYATNGKAWTERFVINK